MFGWLRGEDEIASFWRWFGKNAGRIRAAVDRQDQSVTIHELGRRIAKAAPGVVHEIGKPDNETVELIFSADGMKAGVPGVLALMERAPRLDRFLFTAFRPRHPGCSLKINDETYTPGELRYVSAADEAVLHLRIFVPGDHPERARETIGFLLLDQVLGEYDVMTGLGRIDFVSEAIDEGEPLTSLAAEFDAFRALTAH